jgi:phosphoribosylglycinamide formyltransferase 1
MAVRVAVLASGRGTNLKAIVDHLAERGGTASANVVLVASNRIDAAALTFARESGIEATAFDAKDDGSTLLALLRKYDIELLALAGYLKRIPPMIVREYEARILNIHPGLLPEFGGEGMYGSRVHEAVLASGATSSGVTVHFVDDEFDHGAVIAQWKVAVMKDDTPASLAARVLEVEHLVYPRVVEMVAALNERHFFADF